MGKNTDYLFGGKSGQAVPIFKHLSVLFLSPTLFSDLPRCLFLLLPVIWGENISKINSGQGLDEII